MAVVETAGIIQPTKAKAVVPVCVSVSVTPPVVTGPPVLQIAIWKVTNMSPPLSLEDTRLFVIANVAGPTVGEGGGMVVATDSKRAPPQLLVL